MYCQIYGERRNRSFTPVDITNGLIRVVPTVVGRACGPLGDIAGSMCFIELFKRLEGMSFWRVDKWDASEWRFVVTE
jgi:hypothetical protein